MAQLGFLVQPDGNVWIVNYSLKNGNRVPVLRHSITDPDVIEEVMIPEATLIALHQQGKLRVIQPDQVRRAGGRVYVAAKTKWGA